MTMSSNNKMRNHGGDDLDSSWHDSISLSEDSEEGSMEPSSVVTSSDTKNATLAMVPNLQSSGSISVQNLLPSSSTQADERRHTTKPLAEPPSPSDFNRSSYSFTSPPVNHNSVTALRQNTSLITSSPPDSSGSRPATATIIDSQQPHSWQPQQPPPPLSLQLQNSRSRLYANMESISNDAGDDEMEDSWRGQRSFSPSRSETQSTLYSLSSPMVGNTTTSTSHVTNSHSRTTITTSTATTIRSIETLPSDTASQPTAIVASNAALATPPLSPRRTNTLTGAGATTIISSSSWLTMKSPTTPSEHGSIFDSQRTFKRTISIDEISPVAKATLMVELSPEPSMRKKYSPNLATISQSEKYSLGSVDAGVVVGGAGTPRNSNANTRSAKKSPPRRGIPASPAITGGMRKAQSESQLHDALRNSTSKSRTGNQVDRRALNVGLKSNSPSTVGVKSKKEKKPYGLSSTSHNKSSNRSPPRPRPPSSSHDASRRNNQGETSSSRRPRRPDSMGGGSISNHETNRRRQDLAPTKVKSFRERAQDGEVSLHDYSNRLQLLHTQPNQDEYKKSPDSSSPPGPQHPTPKINRSKSLEQEIVFSDRELSSLVDDSKDDRSNFRRIQSLEAPSSGGFSSLQSSPSSGMPEKQKSTARRPRTKKDKKRLEGLDEGSLSPERGSYKKTGTVDYNQLLSPQQPPQAIGQYNGTTPRWNTGSTPLLDRKARRTLPRQMEIRDDIDVPDNSTHGKLVDRLMKLNTKPSLESSSRLLHLSLRNMNFEGSMVLDFKESLQTVPPADHPVSATPAIGQDLLTTHDIQIDRPRPRMSSPTPTSMDSTRAYGTPTSVITGDSTKMNRGRKTARNGAVPTTSSDQVDEENGQLRRFAGIDIAEGSVLEVGDDDSVRSDITDGVSWGATPSLEFSKRTRQIMEMDAINEGSTELTWMHQSQSGDGSMSLVLEGDTLDDSRLVDTPHQDNTHRPHSHDLCEGDKLNDGTLAGSRLDSSRLDESRCGIPDTSLSTNGTLGTIDRRAHLSTRWMSTNEILDTPKTPMRSVDRGGAPKD